MAKLEEETKLTFGNQIFDVPSAIISELDIFLEIYCKHTWDTLRTEDKERLKKLLPSSQNDGETLNLLTELFDASGKSNECHRRLQADWYRADRPSREVQIRDNARLLYDHAIRKYYIQLLKKLLASRRKILETAATTPQVEKPPYPPNSSSVDKGLASRRERIRKRSAKRARIVIQDCKQQVSETGLSSDEERKKFLILFKKTVSKIL